MLRISQVEEDAAVRHGQVAVALQVGDEIVVVVERFHKALEDLPAEGLSVAKILEGGHHPT